MTVPVTERAVIGEGNFRVRDFRIRRRPGFDNKNDVWRMEGA